MTDYIQQAYISSTQATRLLGVDRVSVAHLIRQGKVQAVKIANRWLIPRVFIEDFAKTYEGKRGRPRRKRKYVKRSYIWRRK